MRFVWKILGMVGRAMGFAALLGAGYALVRGGLLRARGEKPDWKRERILLLLVLYLAALLHITVIRGGAHWGQLLSLERGWETVQLVPIWYTVKELERGILAFLYPVLGNIGWYLPYVMLVTLAAPRWGTLPKVALTGAGLSLGIEVMQWMLGSGISDIDDVIFNVAGAVLGYWLLRVGERRREGRG